MSRTVLITDCDMGPADLERSVLEPAGWTVVHGSCRTEEDVVAAVGETGAAGLLVQYAPITAAVLRACPSVRGLARYGVGMDTVDVAAAQELGVAALNVPDYGAAEVADHTMALLLGLLRRVPTWSAATAAGRWPARGDLADPLELRQCVLGLVGFGAIAREVAVRARAFGMEVLAHDPFVPPTQMAARGVRAVELDELCRSSTAVSVHAPLTAATTGLVGMAAIGLMAPGSFLINCARAGLVDRAALEAGLAEGRLAGIGLDVWWEEPARTDDALLRDSRLVVTPHVAWLSAGSIRRLRTSAAQRLLDVLVADQAAPPSAGGSS
jgi:D-3-phosphoglycerate dehydrogenase / 2-oxoglutarate reductase